MNDPHWTAYFSALLMPVIAGFAVYVASSQWTTARNKLRFDLFEKRYAVYDAARRFLHTVIANGKVDDAELAAYIRGTQAAKWVVAREVHEYLEREIYDYAIELQCFAAELEGMPFGDQRNANLKRQAAAKKHLYQQSQQLDTWFSGYLQLSH